MERTKARKEIARLLGRASVDTAKARFLAVQSGGMEAGLSEVADKCYDIAERYSGDEAVEKAAAIEEQGGEG